MDADDRKTNWKIACITRKLLYAHHQFIILKLMTEYQPLNIPKEIKILTNCINKYKWCIKIYNY